MMVRESNEEPKLMMILSMAGLCEASRSTGTPHFVRELIPSRRAGKECRLSLSHRGPRRRAR